MPGRRHSHICFLEQRRGSLQRAPSGAWGMCAHIGGETLRQGLAGVVYFQRVVLRMCWEVEELRELSALWFGFHLPGTQLGGLGAGSARVLCLDNSANKAEDDFLCVHVWQRDDSVQSGTRKWLTTPFFFFLHLSLMWGKKKQNMQTTKLNSSRTGKCQSELTVISAVVISLFLSRHTNTCSDRHRAKCATLH